MSSIERRLVHERLKDVRRVKRSARGTSPSLRVVVPADNCCAPCRGRPGLTSLSLDDAGGCFWRFDARDRARSPARRCDCRCRFGWRSTGFHCVCAPRSRGVLLEAEHGSAISSNTGSRRTRASSGACRGAADRLAGVALARPCHPACPARVVPALVRPGGIAVCGWARPQSPRRLPGSRAAGRRPRDGPAGLYVLRSCGRRRRVFRAAPRCEETSARVARLP